jgi:hypothetical protein
MPLCFRAYGASGKMTSRMRFKTGMSRGLWWTPLVAALVVLPFFWRGTSNGDDMTFHVNSWIEVARQWKSGILYPHWAVFANYGSGEPRFVFYPPLSWMSGALLGLILPWPAVPGALSVLVCLAAGISMYLFAREWLDESTAVFAAVIYAVNPYQLVLIYQRAAFGELVASIWLPGILLFALRDRGGFWRNALLLGLHVAAVWLTNLPSAVIASYLLAFVVVLRAIQLRRLEPLLRAATAMALGLGLAAFYLVPAAYEQRWVQISQAVGPGARPLDNFLFGSDGDIPHDKSLLRLSIFASFEFLAAALLAWWSRSLRQRSAALYYTLLATLVLCAFLMFPISDLVWNHAPKLMFVQFPWRWLLVFNVALVTLAAVVLARSRTTRWMVVVGIPVLIAGMNWKFQQTIYPEDRPVALAEAIDVGPGYEGTDEYAPTHADNSTVEPNAPRIAIQISTDSEDQHKIAPSSLVHTSAQVWEAEKKRFTIDGKLPTRDTLRLLDYPAWKVTVDGEPFRPEPDETTGRMVLELPSGHHEVAIDYVRTPDHLWGMIISAIALVVWLGLYLFTRMRGIATPEPAP